MESEAKIYVAGHTGLVGSALMRILEERGYSNIVTKMHQELDLTQQSDVESFFEAERPECVILAAARVGGIHANVTYPAEFIYENLAIQTNVIHAAYTFGVKRLLFFGSACSYPRHSPQPMKEEHILSGSLEPTNEAYAVAKIAGMKMCEAYNRQYGANFISIIPTNTYGPNDHFNPETSHVVPALIRKFHEAKMERSPFVTIWGSGNAIRDFIYVDDLADASIYLMKNCDGGIINVGTGEGVTIKELAKMVKDVVGYGGKITFDTSKPDGMLRKVLDISELQSLNWQAGTNLRDGISKTYEWYICHLNEFVESKICKKIF